MRLFVAINFDDQAKQQIRAVQRRVSENAVKGNFSREENLHLTLVFLGETSADLVPAITTLMAESKTAPFKMVFSRLGCFTHSRKDLWWIGIDENDVGTASLEQLRRELTGGLRGRGIPFDDRAFNAHITLGREIRLSRPVDRHLEALVIPVTRISLMKSERPGGRLIYTEVFGWELRYSRNTISSN
jgi:2'-5' RNA ligase